MENRPPYKGDSRQLVLAMDVGTTYSGISYAILDPGRPPVIESVTRYPAKEGIIGDHKIPTVILYGPNGDVRAVGAEAEQESFVEEIETERLIKAEWFKLHLRPRHLQSPQVINHIPPLPLGKSIVSIFADFLRYMYQCAKTFITESHLSGASVWESKKDIILTHPNGWEGAQQALMRQAAIQAGLVPDTQEGRDSIHFVTEGEASLHFCVANGLVPRELKSGAAVLVVDAGGGTVDISGYKKKSDDAFVFEEAAAPQCHFHGSIFVTQHAKLFLQDYLRDSKYIDVVDDIARCFDRTTKLGFRDPSVPAFIKFGTMRDRDPNFNIRSGQLRLDGAEVARFYEPSISCISRAIAEAKYNRQVKCAFLVGGFAGNDWLFTSLKEKFQQYNVSIIRPDHHSSKAVADGAVSFYLDHYVRARVSKYVYGMQCSIQYDSSDPEHRRRESTKSMWPDGMVCIPNAFDTILPKDTEVEETKEFRRPYYRCSRYRSAFFNRELKTEIHSYRGTLNNPQWASDGSPGDWRVTCTVVADAASVNGIIQQGHRNGLSYYTINYEVILLFGLTELKAQICWKENGQERRSTASVVYETDI
ncbi:hypothetical protein AX16_003244 [Volvariella volvacea WC 439]|nr:hypothetical protein AX16_003244 [Volvariella volvacea WC 439]